MPPFSPTLKYPRLLVSEGKLAAVAEKEHRRLADMIKVMTRDYCEKAGITLEEEGRSCRPAYTHGKGQ